MVWGDPAPARARQTGVPERTLYEKADRFDREGMPSLFKKKRVRGPTLDPEIRRLIVDLKVQHPPMGLGEIAQRLLGGSLRDGGGTLEKLHNLEDGHEPGERLVAVAVTVLPCAEQGEDPSRQERGEILSKPVTKDIDYPIRWHCLELRPPSWMATVYRDSWC